MTRGDYYEDRRFCAHCQTYVRYLLSLQKSYCVQCGRAVTLFSSKDNDSFQKAIAKLGRGTGFNATDETDKSA